MSSKKGPLIAAGVVGAGVAASLFGAGLMFSKTVLRPGETDPDIIDEFADREKMEEYMKKMEPVGEWMVKQEPEHVNITARDGIRLHGLFFPNDGETKKLAIILHGFTSKAEDGSVHIKTFHEMGFAVLAVDMRAHGESEGKYVGFGILDRFDTLEWIRYGRKRFGEDLKVVLHGVSMGATTALMTLGVPEAREAISAVVADCAFTSPDAIFSHVMKKDYHLPSFPVMNLSNLLSKFTAGYSGDEYSTLEALADNDTVPVLFIHGSEDKFVPVWMAEQNYEACHSEKEKLIMEGAGHGSSAFEDPELYCKTERDFLSRFDLV